MFRQLHLWVGLLTGVFIAMMGLTGMVIVFRPVFESWAAPRPNSGSAFASLAPMERSFAESYPSARISSVTISETSPGLLLVQAQVGGKRRSQIYFDAADGQELGPKKTIAWLDWLADLHQNLLMGKSGRALTGVIGIALLLIALSGIISWLAGARDWRRGLALPRMGPWRRTNYELHRWAGLWANLLLLTVSLTGIVLAYPELFEKTIQLATGQRQAQREMPRVKPSGRTPEHLLPLDAYLQPAIAAIPGGMIREVRLPSRAHPAVSITLWAPGDFRFKGENVVAVDPNSARVISIERSSNAPLSRRLVALANAIHKTELGGMPVKAAWSLVGLVPLLLFLSGVQIWWSRKQKSVRDAVARGDKRVDPVAVSSSK